ncbi:MAG TPA: hypothetical protein VJ891_08595, partial [Casimicrobiaceae bacterium]|nr:hypothetical protein [Casimicrobiaceae bacterium]
PATFDPLQIWGSGPNDIYIVNNDTPNVLHSVGGGSWSAFTIPNFSGNSASSVWGTSATNVFFGASFDVIEQYKGSNMFSANDCGVATNQTYLAVMGDPTGTDVFAISTNGRMCFSGTMPIVFNNIGGLPSTSTNVALWINATTDGYVIGNHFDSSTSMYVNDMAHWNGSQWTQQTPPPFTGRMRAIYGFGPSAVYVVGDNAQIASYNGSMWTVATVPPANGLQLFSVWGTDPQHLYVGGLGIIRSH